MKSHGENERWSGSLSAANLDHIPSSYSCLLLHTPWKLLSEKNLVTTQLQHSSNLIQTSGDIYSLVLFFHGGMFGYSPIKGISVISGQVMRMQAEVLSVMSLKEMTTSFPFFPLAGMQMWFQDLKQPCLDHEREADNRAFGHPLGWWYTHTSSTISFPNCYHV